MKVGTRVRLQTFNGIAASKKKVPAAEDYWRLVGRDGAVVDSPEEKSGFPDAGPDARVCVRFDDDLKKLGLEAHNRIPNSLWVRTSDLSSQRRADQDRQRTTRGI